MRVENARPIRNGGWFYKFDADKPKRPIPFEPLPAAPKIDAAKIMDEWRKENPADAIPNLAAQLGVNENSLIHLGAVWSWEHSAFAFPMFDESRNPIGIRLRDERGNKWAVTGSRQGLFIPLIPASFRLFICEGPTDTAAALSLNLYAIGRPSCNGCIPMIQDFVRINAIREIILVSDADGPGFRGASQLSASLAVRNCFFTPPSKDLREFVQSGGSELIIKSCLSSIVWNKFQK